MKIVLIQKKKFNRNNKKNKLKLYQNLFKELMLIFYHLEMMKKLKTMFKKQKIIIIKINLDKIK